MPLEDGQEPNEIEHRRKHLRVEEKLPKNEQICLSSSFDIFECPPPKTENEVRISGGEGLGLWVEASASKRMPFSR